MADAKSRSSKELDNEMTQRQQEPKIKHPPYKDIIEVSMREQDSEGFTKDGILQRLLTYYKVRDKRTAMVQVNAAFRNGLKNGSLKRISGTGKTASFMLVKANAEPSSKGKSPKRKREPNSQEENKTTTGKTQVRMMSIKDSQKEYGLHKRTSSTTTSDTESTARTIDNTKDRRRASKIKQGKKLTAPCSVSKIYTTTPKLTVSQPPEGRLVSPEAAMLDGTSASNTLTMMGFQQTVLIETNPVAGVMISGLAVLSDGRKLITDKINVRLYSSDIKPLFSLRIAAEWDYITDVAVYSENVAIVMLQGGNPRIQFIDIAPEVLSVSHSINLTLPDIPGYYITACRGFIFYNSGNTPCSIRKIDTAGIVCWTVSGDYERKLLFDGPNLIRSYERDNSIRLVVIDGGRDSKLMLLDGESGDVLFVRAGNFRMCGLTTDPFNNIYISYSTLGLVSVMNSDLSEERVILTKPGCEEKYREALANDLDEYSQYVVFDHKSNSLLVTSWRAGFNFNAGIQIYQFR